VTAKLIATVFAAGLIAAAGGAAFAQGLDGGPSGGLGGDSGSIGAPTSAAGGIHADPLAPPPAVGLHSVGPLDSGSEFGHGSLGGSTSDGIRERTPGTGKFETPDNGPCIGSTGFGSTEVQPGMKC